MYRVFTLTQYGTVKTDCMLNSESKARCRVLELEHAGYIATYEAVL